VNTVIRNAAAASLLFGICGAASALEPGHLDGYYIPSASLDVKIPGEGSGDDDGDGFGAALYLPLTTFPNLVFTGEYQGTQYDDTDIDLDQYRIGAAWQGDFQTLTYALRADYVNFDFEDSEADGFGIHGRLVAPVADRFGLYAEVGYLFLEDDYEDIEGPEYVIGVYADFTPNFGAFADYRATMAETQESDVDLDFKDFRVGVRFRFGGMM